MSQAVISRCVKVREGQVKWCQHRSMPGVAQETARRAHMAGVGRSERRVIGGGQRVRQGGGGENNHIALRGPGLLLCNMKFFQSVEQKKDMVLFTFQFKKAMLRRD